MVQTFNVNGVELIDDHDDIKQAMRNRGGSWESQSMMNWRVLAKSNLRSWVIDVGAYSGAYSIAAAQEGARVVAFEPNPYAFQRLLANRARQSAQVRTNIVAHQVAISDGKAASVGMSHLNRGPLNSGTQVVPIDEATFWASARSLDSYSMPDPVTAIKIDAEGHEPKILAGAVQLITRCRPTIITEALSDGAYARQWSVLRQLGYYAVSLDSCMYVWSYKKD